MGPSQTLTLFPLFLSLFSPCCFCMAQGDPSPNCIDEAPGYSTRAYPTCFRNTRDQESELGPGFPSLVVNEKQFFSLVRFARVGSHLTAQTVVSVDDFGAKGDRTDDTKAFEKAWEEACSLGASVLVIPNKNYLVKPSTFNGPCKSALTIQIYGTVEAPDDRTVWKGSNQNHWLLFENINNLTVEGGGTINGNGEIWWKHSCKINTSKPCEVAPTAITFDSCTNLSVTNLRIKDSQQIHLSFKNCMNVQAFNLIVTAPGTSPNTDGIHISGSKNVLISNSVIGTGDDCISIVSGSQNIKAMDINCGPGHGISIGSLGADNSEAQVSNITVNRTHLQGTTNGLRIKTWQGGSGYARHIVFQNISLQNVSNPIIIDQNYCDSEDPCPEKDSAVDVSDVVYRNIKGTSATKVALKFDCSKKFPCSGIVFEDINLVTVSMETPTVYCKNAEGVSRGSVHPHACF